MKAQRKVTAREVLTDPVHFLAFGFGTGLAPRAPGTVGSLPGVLLAWLTLDLGFDTQLGVAAIGLFLVGIPICGISARKLGIHDHGGIVWDEICGHVRHTFAGTRVSPGFCGRIRIVSAV